MGKGGMPNERAQRKWDESLPTSQRHVEEGHPADILQMKHNCVKSANSITFNYELELSTWVSGLFCKSVQ